MWEQNKVSKYLWNDYDSSQSKGQQWVMKNVNKIFPFLSEDKILIFTRLLPGAFSRCAQVGQGAQEKIM
jgi:hypothetical protein